MGRLTAQKVGKFIFPVELYKFVNNLAIYNS